MPRVETSGRKNDPVGDVLCILEGVVTAVTCDDDLQPQTNDGKHVRIDCCIDSYVFAELITVRIMCRCYVGTDELCLTNRGPQPSSPDPQRF